MALCSYSVQCRLLGSESLVWKGAKAKLNPSKFFNTSNLVVSKSFWQERTVTCVSPQGTGTAVTTQRHKRWQMKLNVHAPGILKGKKNTITRHKALLKLRLPQGQHDALLTPALKCTTEQPANMSLLLSHCLVTKHSQTQKQSLID